MCITGLAWDLQVSQQAVRRWQRLHTPPKRLLDYPISSLRKKEIYATMLSKSRI